MSLLPLIAGLLRTAVSLVVSVVKPKPGPDVKPLKPRKRAR